MVDKLDEAWRSRGIKNRMESFRGALAHYLKQLGAEDTAALFADATVVWELAFKPRPATLSSQRWRQPWRKRVATCRNRRWRMSTK